MQLAIRLQELVLALAVLLLKKRKRERKKMRKKDEIKTCKFFMINSSKQRSAPLVAYIFTSSVEESTPLGKARTSTQSKAK